MHSTILRDRLSQIETQIEEILSISLGRPGAAATWQRGHTNTDPGVGLSGAPVGHRGDAQDAWKIGRLEDF